MTSYAVLLRGVNVGGHRKVAMPELEAALESLGYAEVATYLQSGNAVLTATGTSEALAASLTRGLSEALGVELDVLARSGAELAELIAANPFPDAVADPKFLHVAFLSAEPSAQRRDAVDPAAYAPDEFRFGKRALYLRYRTSPGRSKLGGGALNKLGVVVTARNWTTVCRLAELTAD